VKPKIYLGQYWW